MLHRAAPVFALGLLFLTTSCEKKGKPAAPAPTINVQVTIFKLPRALAADIVFYTPPAGDHNAVHAQIQQLVAEGKAALVATPSISTPSGQRAVAESILEVRYPTEFDPPQIPQTFAQTETTTTTTTTTTNAPAEIRAVPTAFETRNTGMTLECEPDVLANGTVGVNLVIQFVALQTMNKYVAFSQGDKVITLDQPYFYTKKLSTSTSAPSGQALFLGTMEPDRTLEKAGDDLVEVVFVRATILPSPATGG